MDDNSKNETTNKWNAVIEETWREYCSDLSVKDVKWILGNGLSEIIYNLTKNQRSNSIVAKFVKMLLRTELQKISRIFISKL